MKLYMQLATLAQAMENCQKSGNSEWFEKHGDKIDELVYLSMPHGSGFDSGTTFDNVRSTPDKLVLLTHFHHTDENGSYVFWTDHTVTVRPSLAHGFRLAISGRNRNDIKEYMYEIFDQVLNEEV